MIAPSASDLDLKIYSEAQNGYRNSDCSDNLKGELNMSEVACEKGCCGAIRTSQEEESEDGAVLCSDECCKDDEPEDVKPSACGQGYCSSPIEKIHEEHGDENDGQVPVLCSDECCENDEPEDVKLSACGQGCCSSPIEKIHEEHGNENDGQVPVLCSDECCENDEPEDVKLPACGQGCCSSPIEKIHEEHGDENDDSLCPCCIEVLVQYPDAIGRTLLEAQSSVPALFPKDSAHRLSASIRKCCRLFEAFCAQKSCCFQLPKAAHAVSGPPTSKQPVETTVAKDTPSHSSIHQSTEELLKLEVTGMDCADCCTKVSRALSSLPSVKRIHVQYLEAVASFSYDADCITPEAITRYVARATGFRCKAIGNGDSRPPSYFTLPVTFRRPPPACVLEKFSPRPRSELGGFTELSFSIHGDKSHQPRRVLAELAEYGAALVPSDALRRMDDRVSQDFHRLALRTLCIILLAVPVLILAWAPLPGSSLAHGLASVILTTLIQVAAFPILSSSVRFLLFVRAVDMSVLVSVSNLAAWLFSLVAFACAAAGTPFADPFFETVALLLALVHIGRLVQAATRRIASSAVRELQQMQPADVVLVEQIGRSTVETPLDARLMYYGDVLRVAPATRIPTDGVVIAGSSAVDESSVTGESLPSAKRVGSLVKAGSLNLDGALNIQVTQLMHENYLVRIAHLVRDAQATRSRFQDLADRFSAVVLPVSAASAAIAFLAWFMVNRCGRHLAVTPAAVSGLTYALAVLIVSCPCAIGVAVPLVVAAAFRAGRRNGVIFRSSEALQRAHDVDTIVFDKTGTLSCGLFSLQQKELLAHGVNTIIRPLISSSEHPVSKAILAHVSDDNAQIQAAPGIVSLPGMGVKAILAGYPLLGGNSKFTGATQHPVVQDLTARGLTLFTVTLGGELIAAFGLADAPRVDAPALLQALAARGKGVYVLSGDNAGAVARFAAVLSMEPCNVRAACTPADKAEFVKTLQAQGQRVCFVGDGTNDAPALAQADVALCVAAGADVAVAAAGALVPGESMKSGVLAALDVAKHAHQHMLAALGWCVLYNAFALLFAGGVFVRVRIEPQWAGLGELVSLAPVLLVGIALDLRWRWRCW